MRRMLTTAVMFAAFTLAGCMSLEKMHAAGPDQPAASKEANLPRTDTIELQGTVVKKDLEGGFFVIEGEDGKVYQPINLPDDFRRNGVQVRATVRVREDAVSIHMAGDIVEIVKMEAK